MLNIESTKAFYIDTLHFQVEMEMEAFGEKIVFLTNGDVRLELVENQEQTSSHICFEVGSINRLLENGISLMEGPYIFPNGWKTVFIQGLSGEVIEFLQIK